MATARDIIDQLGGSASIAKATGFSLTTVNSWKDANFIPDWRRDALLSLAGEAGVKLKAADFPTPAQRISRTRPADARAA